MPRNFPEIWLDRVETNLREEPANFLEGIQELPFDALELGDENVIHLPASDFNVDVMVNSKSLPLSVQSYNDTSIIVNLDKFITKPTVITDDQTQGASYDIIDFITKGHRIGIANKKYSKTLSAFAPDSNTEKTPIIDIDEIEIDENTTEKKCTYKSLLRLKRALDNAGWPSQGRRLVLTNDHWNDLLEDKERFSDKIIDYEKGLIKGMVLGFKIYGYRFSPRYTVNKTKRDFNVKPASTDLLASVAFLEGNVGLKTGRTKQYFLKAENNPKGQANELNYRHYFMATPKQDRYKAALI